VLAHEVRIINLFEGEKMAKFAVAVSWSVFGEMNIEAKTLEEAIQIAREDDSISLPEGEYMDGSFVVDPEMSKELNK